jgi:hypothetical protein
MQKNDKPLVWVTDDRYFSLFLFWRENSKNMNQDNRREEFIALTVSQIRSELRAASLVTSGNKSELVQRLLDFEQKKDKTKGKKLGDKDAKVKEATKSRLVMIFHLSLFFLLFFTLYKGSRTKNKHSLHPTNREKVKARGRCCTPTTSHKEET